MYIRYTRPMNPISITSGKVPRVKPAKWHEVPKDYRSKKIEKRRAVMSEILLFFMGFIEFIRKGVKK